MKTAVAGVIAACLVLSVCRLNFKSTDIPVVDNTITVSRSLHHISSNGFIMNINGGDDGDMLILQSDHYPIIDCTRGNIWCSTSIFEFLSDKDTITFINNDGNWLELSQSHNGS